MGVPGLFSYLLKKYNSSDEEYSIIKRQIPLFVKSSFNNNNINNGQEIHLYLDFNGGIYQNIKPEIKTEQSLITAIIQYLDNLVKLFNIPQSNTDNTNNRLTKLFIAIDGVPPRAKMEQQRIRRYHSGIRKREQIRLFDKYAEPTEECKINKHIDTNMITPGTQFMNKLSRAIEVYITNSPELFNHIEVHFTDWRIPGEGEHKILAHLKDNIVTASSPNIANVIYGLDGDLIMLALASQLDNIYLLREAYEYGNYAFQHKGFPYLYLDIAYLKESLLEDCSEMISQPLKSYSTQTINRIMDDYICLMMLLGNDFMPKIKWMSIKQDGHRILLETYFQLFNGNDEIDREKDRQFLYNRTTGRINRILLADIFRIIACSENKLAHKFFKERIKPRVFLPRELTEFERQMKKMEFTPLRYTKTEIDVIMPIDDGNNANGRSIWRKNYYTLCHNMVPCSENITKIVEAYLHTFLWNIKYYLHGYMSCDWDHYYPYDYSPTISDISIYLENNNITQTIKLSTAEPKPLKPLELLTVVLPIRNRDLMPNALCKKMQQYGNDVFFPVKYELNMWLHSRYYECTPVIPKININLIRQLSTGCKLTEKEKMLNSLGEHKIF